MSDAGEPPDGPTGVRVCVMLDTQDALRLFAHAEAEGISTVEFARRVLREHVNRPLVTVRRDGVRTLP